MDTNYNDICIHIQTHLPHFKYTNKLINSILDLTNIKELKIPIYIVFDNKTSIIKYKLMYKYKYDLIKFINTKKVINNLKLRVNEKNTDLFDKVIDLKWGKGGHRNYVAIKRTYSILELENRGYKYIWCLDSESLVLKETDLTIIFDHNIKKPILVVGTNNNGIKYPELVEKLFKFNYDDYYDISVRMNDFWFIHSKYYKNMIEMLFDIHNMPISYFMNGSEQSVYEYYLYSMYMRDNKSISLIKIDGDLHGNTLFNKVINNNNIDIKDFANKMNNDYFNYIRSYRGDYYINCLNYSRGVKLINHLNINIAVSNYLGR